MKILVFGLPGSGKTVFSKKLASALNIYHINADSVRELFNDWDFTTNGRFRQLQRMIYLSDLHDDSVSDFVCPKESFRQRFDADITVWMNTIQSGRYDDTNKVFEPPTKVDYTINNFEEVDTCISSIKQLFTGS